MTTFTIIAIILVIVILTFLIVLLSIPQKKEPKKKSKEELALEQQKAQLQDTIKSLREELHAIRGEEIAYKKKLMHLEKELFVEKAKTKKLQEKVSQERQWLDKEEAVIEGRNKEIQNLKQELIKVHEGSAREHAETLKLERETKDFKVQVSGLHEEKKVLAFEIAQLKAKVENQRTELVEFKKENAELKKKKEDTSWIAKTEYERVKGLLEEKEKEISRMRREQAS